jgi:hypothetical protein
VKVLQMADCWVARKVAKMALHWVVWLVDMLAVVTALRMVA